MIALEPDSHTIWVDQWPDIFVTVKEDIVQGVASLMDRLLREVDELTVNDRTHLELLRYSSLDCIARDDSD